MRLLRGFLPIALLTFAACGDDPSPCEKVHPPEPAPVQFRVKPAEVETPEQALQLRTDALCACLYPDWKLKDCRTSALLNWSISPTQVKAGSARFNVKALRACAERWAECRDLHECSPFEGTLKQGERCIGSVDCEPGLYCEGAQSASDQLCAGSRCSPRRFVGQACESSEQCALPSVCVPDQNNQGVCGSPRSAGEACGVANSSGGLLLDDASCKKGLVCDLTCIAPEDQTSCSQARLGEKCHGFECAFPYTCSEDDVCVPPPQNGEPCPSRFCDVGLVCRDGTCRPRQQEGDSCSTDCESVETCELCAPPYECYQGTCVDRWSWCIEGAAKG